uniref:Putative neurotoxin LTDF 10-02 n=1 Tax=Dolomedes fimbriatus TaxID=1432569 RepID=A0A0K1D8W3_9ARAC|nr:putative neurotoxin LTDF 10-02 [Dolomedes fimbriatus]
MRPNIYVFVFAVSLMVLFGVHAEQDSSDYAELTLEELRSYCAGAYKTCSKAVKCCKNGFYKRTCYCSTPAGTNCKCKKTLREIAGGWI